MTVRAAGRVGDAGDAGLRANRVPLHRQRPPLRLRPHLPPTHQARRFVVLVDSHSAPPSCIALTRHDTHDTRTHTTHAHTRLTHTHDTTHTGTRYHIRGADEQGHVASFGETEQVLVVPAQERIYSFVQTRGSTPVFRNQAPDITYKPKPRLTATEKRNVRAPPVSCACACSSCVCVCVRRVRACVCVCARACVCVCAFCRVQPSRGPCPRALWNASPR